MGAAAGELVDLSKGEVSVATSLDLLRLAAIHAEAGLLTKALLLLEGSQKRDPRVLDRFRFVGLTAGVSDYRSEIATRYAADLRAGSWLQAHRGRFERLVTDCRGGISVVGNSPCELGRGKGPEIDSSEIVIRFNNFSGSVAHKADYGTRVDVWVRSPHYKTIYRRPGFAPHLSLFSSPVYWRKLNAQDILLECANAEQACDEIGVRTYRELAQRLGAAPSSGLATIFWIKEILGGLQGVKLFGFSQVDQIRDRTHYFADMNIRAPSTHDWVAEREVFEALTEHV